MFVMYHASIVTDLPSDILQSHLDSIVQTALKGSVHTRGWSDLLIIFFAFWTTCSFQREVRSVNWTTLILEQIFTILFRLFLSFTE